jgi:hypothetical protein
MTPDDKGEIEREITDSKICKIILYRGLLSYLWKKEFIKSKRKEELEATL